ncbi:MAG: hypothetical protein ACOC4M_12135 [Promethearchaeia archaeon]
MARYKAMKKGLDFENDYLATKYHLKRLIEHMKQWGALGKSGKPLIAEGKDLILLFVIRDIWKKKLEGIYFI